MRAKVCLVVLLAVLCAVMPAFGIDEVTLQGVAKKMSIAAGRSFNVEVVSQIDGDDYNAGAKENGDIQITSKFLEELQSADEAAGVLGHEMAHVVLKHHSGQRKSNILGAILGALVAKVTGADDLSTGAAIGSGIIGGKRSRKDEYAADKKDLELAQKADFNPDGLVTVLKRLQSRYGNGDAGTPVLGWLASHPDTGNRILRLTGESVKPQLQTGTSSKSIAVAGQTAIVVVDPESSESNSYGFGRSYYYNEDISRVAKQETEAALEKRGFRVLVSTQDVGPLQSELELENSEWGLRGEGKKDKGYFVGADNVFYISAYVAGERDVRLGDWRKSAEVNGLKVGVLLRQIDLATRRQIQSFKGTGSANGVTRIRLPFGDRWTNSSEIEVQQVDNLARRAVGGAVAKALATMSASSPRQHSDEEMAQTYAPEPKFETAAQASAAIESLPVISFTGIGSELRLGAEPITLNLQTGVSVWEVRYAVYDADGKKKLEGESDTPPFRVRIDPGSVGGFNFPLKLQAIALNAQGNELGRAEIRLTR